MKSIALYYLTKPRKSVINRYRARFVKRPSDPDDPEIERIRRLRESNEFSKDVYRIKN